MNAVTTDELPLLDDALLRTLVAQRRLAAVFGPLVQASPHTQVSALELDAEPCVVFGVDIHHSDLAWLGVEHTDRLVSRIRSAPEVAIAASLLLRSAHTTAATRFALESATYSLLQAGSAFRRWRLSRPSAEVNVAHDIQPPLAQLVHATDPNDEPVLFHQDGDTLHVTLNRPGRGNAVNNELRDALCEALVPALIDEQLRVHLSGAGKNFCTGGDLDTFGSFIDPANAHVVRLQRSPAQMLQQLRQRLTVDVHGVAAGSGFEFAAFASCVRVAPDATFVLPEFDLGLIPGAGGTVSVVDRIGASKTLLLVLSGESIDAPTALRWGVADSLITSPDSDS